MSNNLSCFPFGPVYYAHYNWSLFVVCIRSAKKEAKTSKNQVEIIAGY